MEKKNIQRIVVNEGQYVFEDFSIDELDMIRENEEIFHILKDNKAYRARLIEYNPLKRVFRISINGSVYRVKLEDSYDALIKEMGLSDIGAHKVKEIKAPMPGLVLDIMVKEGDEIHKGDALIILEAMKMENILKAPGEGIVKKLFTKKGKAVEKSELLIELE